MGRRQRKKVTIEIEWEDLNILCQMADVSYHYAWSLGFPEDRATRLYGKLRKTFDYKRPHDVYEFQLIEED